MQGFCIKVAERAFEFHFCSVGQEDDKKEYEYHHVLQIKDDVLAVMERCGQLPEASLEDHISLIEEKMRMKKEVIEREKQMAEVIKSKDDNIEILSQEITKVNVEKEELAR